MKTFPISFDYCNLTSSAQKKTRANKLLTLVKANFEQIRFDSLVLTGQSGARVNLQKIQQCVNFHLRTNLVISRLINWTSLCDEVETEKKIPEGTFPILFFTFFNALEPVAIIELNDHSRTNSVSIVRFLFLPPTHQIEGFSIKLHEKREKC